MIRICAFAVLAVHAGAQAEFLPAKLRFSDPPASSCVAFRQTGSCSGSGPREPSGDQPCSATIPCHSGSCPSGYCECFNGMVRNRVDCHPGSHDSFTCEDVCAGAAPPVPAPNSTSGTYLTLSNGFVEATVDLVHPSLAALAGDMMGTANFSGGNALGDGGVRLEREDEKGNICASSADAGTGFAYTILSNTTDLVTVRMDGIADCAAAPFAVESWTLSLERASRQLIFNISGATVSSHDGEIAVGFRAVRRVLPLNALSLYAFFDRGVVQMLGAHPGATHFASNDSLQRFYALGGGSAVDVLPLESTSAASSTGTSANTSWVLQSGSPQPSALHAVLFGSLGHADAWGAGWEHAPATTPPAASTSWASSFAIAPNDRNFPSAKLSTGPNLPEKDLEALLTGIYGSSPGCLCTYDNEVVKGKRVAQIATTIARPDRGYGGTYNYFDPDNFISLSAMLYSGDEYLQGQARDVIMRSGAYLKVSNDKFNGQLPHHFVNDQPTYTALSGATQTGPNTFWTKTALQYASTSGDLDWLQSYMPTLRNSSGFCFDLIDPDRHMLDAPGSLMIDVFIREHFTSDSNAMMVGFLREFAVAERAAGGTSGAAKASRLEALSEQVRTAMNAQLWAEGDDDHYVTQRNPDNTTRDFVDYDANLIALAHRVPPTAEQAAKVLKRIDMGRCSAASGAGPQFVSEQYYGKSDTTHGNTGDSWCSMGRIAWFDAHARKVQGDAASREAFDAQLAVLQNDLIRDTWMHERYGCDGQQQQNRTAMYFEYPSTVAMLLREIRYGINLKPSGVEIAPFGPSSFTYDIGNVFVAYDAESGVKLNLPGSGDKAYTVQGMAPGASFALSADPACGATKMPHSADSDPSGSLSFVGPAGCLVSATKMS